MTNIGAEITALESRLHSVEQRSVVGNSPSVSVSPDASGTPVIRDSLTWDAGWRSDTMMKVGQPNPALPDYPDLSWVNPAGTPAVYSPVQVTRIGSFAFLTGHLLRTGTSLGVGGHDLRMFKLPIGWRPRLRVIVACMATGPGGMAWVEIRPDPSVDAGGVYYVAGSVALNQNVGWIALQGAFPCLDQPAI